MAKQVGSVLCSQLSEDRQKMPIGIAWMIEGCSLQESAPSAMSEGGLFYHVIMN